MTLGLACGASSSEVCRGAERCDCYPNGTCDDGLACLSNKCVNQNGGAGGTNPTGGTGGTHASGGTTTGPLPTPASPNCTDISLTSGRLTADYVTMFVPVNGSDKQYLAQTNWWHWFQQQTVTVNGLSFTVGNPMGAITPDNSPTGFPSLYIGEYTGHAGKGSNLPKQVSALTSVNTVFVTNANSKGHSNYNATYDVWFTPTSAPLPADQYDPGMGGAYLMVWFFMPTDRQPRGFPETSSHMVPGLSGTWDVWIDHTDPLCVSYVSTTPLEKLDFDLNNFIQDSVSNGYGITSSMYLSIVFAGFEIWGGGDGVQAKAFCANVL